jgi:cytochrome oxidase assembly protein ShyY1
MGRASVRYVAASFQRRRADDPWSGIQPRPTHLAYTAHWFALAIASPAGQPMLIPLGALTVRQPPREH